MEKERMRRLLARLESGEIELDEAMEELKNLPFEDLGYAKVDHHRHLRRGFPEAVFCAGKTDEQALEIAARMLKSGSAVLTKVSPGLARKLSKRFKGELDYSERARMAILGSVEGKAKGRIAIVTAGTSDIGVAEEAAMILEKFGVKVDRVFDVGVAGVHRIVPSLPIFEKADALIVVAGMEGALPSVVAGMTDKPVIAVPTSIGYGANFEGIAALLGMLCSCSPGIAIVNIDNGFGAGVFALSILRGKKRH